MLPMPEHLIRNQLVWRLAGQFWYEIVPIGQVHLAHSSQRSLTYRTPRPDGWMHQRTTSSVPSDRGRTHGSPKEKSLHSVCSPDVPFCVGDGARQTSPFASM